MRTLSHDEARRVYDRIGARQDTQAFYEDVATRELSRHGEFEFAAAVFEFGLCQGAPPLVRYGSGDIEAPRTEAGPLACPRRAA